MVQTSLRIGAHKDDVNAVCFGEDSPNIIVTGSDDRLIKVCCGSVPTLGWTAASAAVLQLKLLLLLTQKQPLLMLLPHLFAL